MNNRDNLLGVFQTLYRWRKWIFYICLAALAGAVVFALLQKNYYKATTICYAASPEMANPEQMFGVTGTITHYYGSDRDLDRLLEIAMRDEVVDSLVRKFSLYSHYDLDSTDRLGPDRIRKTFRSLFTAEKNKNDALEISVEDTDPQMAAALANAARDQVDAVARRINKDPMARMLHGYESNISAKQAELKRLTDSLRTTQRRYGIYDPEAQGEQLAVQLAKATSEIMRYKGRLEVLQANPAIPADTITYLRAQLRGYEKMLQELTKEPGNGSFSVARQYNEGLPQVAIWRDLHFQARKQLSYDLEKYYQLRAALQTDVPAILIVEPANTPLVKSRPKRSLLVLGAVLAAFLFSLLGVLAADAYRDVRWRDVLNDA